MFLQNMDYAQTHFNTDAVRDICKACAIYNAGTQIYIYTHIHSMFVLLVALSCWTRHISTLLCRLTVLNVRIYARIPIDLTKHAEFLQCIVF